MTTQTVGPETVDVGTMMAKLASFKGCRFASMTYRTVETNELQKVLIDLGFSTRSMYVRDRVKLERHIIPTLKVAGSEIKLEVAQELLDSRIESLTVGIGNNSKYTQQDTWITIPGLHGIKIRRDNGTVNVSGLCIRKEVLEAGTYKPDTRRPRTKVKDAIRHELPSRRFRTYRLDKIGTMKLNGETLIIDTNP